MIVLGARHGGLCAAVTTELGVPVIDGVAPRRPGSRVRCDWAWGTSARGEHAAPTPEPYPGLLGRYAA